MVQNSQIVSAAASNQVPNVKVFVCPNDPYLVIPTASQLQGLLSYGVNDGFFVNRRREPADGPVRLCGLSGEYLEAHYPSQLQPAASASVTRFHHDHAWGIVGQLRDGGQ